MSLSSTFKVLQTSFHLSNQMFYVIMYVYVVYMLLFHTSYYLYRNFVHVIIFFITPHFLSKDIFLFYNLIHLNDFSLKNLS